MTAQNEVSGAEKERESSTAASQQPENTKAHSEDIAQHTAHSEAIAQHTQNTEHTRHSTQEKGHSTGMRGCGLPAPPSRPAGPTAVGPSHAASGLTAAEKTCPLPGSSPDLDNSDATCQKGHPNGGNMGEVHPCKNSSWGSHPATIPRIQRTKSGMSCLVTRGVRVCFACNLCSA